MNDWFEAEQRIERAQQLSESARWEEALVELEAAIAINPCNALWQAQRGFILEELDQLHDAVAAYRQAIELDPEDREVSVALGAALACIGEQAEALEVFDELATRHAEFEPAYCHRISIYTELGRHDQAEEMFYLAQELDESCPHCFFSIGVSLAERGQLGRAIYCWQRVQELEPGYAGVNARIGMAYRSQGRIKKAQEFLLKELREDPGNTDLLFKQAQLYLEDGDAGPAKAKLLQLLELEPEHVESHLMLGMIALRRGAAARALDHFQAAREVADEQTPLPEFDEYCGEALYRLGRFAEAQPYLERATQDARDSIGTNLLLSHCLALGGQPDQAATGYRRVLANDPDNTLAHHNLGLCLFRLGAFESGLEHCAEAARLDPNYTAAMYKTAMALVHLGRWRDARLWIAQARKIAPQDEALGRLARRLWRYRLQRAFGWLAKRLGGRAARKDS